MEVEPIDLTNRHHRYNTSRKGKARSANYDSTSGGLRRRGQYRESLSTRNYLNRQFVGWDGEGGNDATGTHCYFLLASSRGHIISDRQGLSTEFVFDLWLSFGNEKVTHIGYGFNYDINMILKDLDYGTLDRLYVSGQAEWQGYSLQWRGGKSFRVAKGGRSFLVYDVLPFFQRPFVGACDEYLGTDWIGRDKIIADKQRRGNFSWDEIDDIITYNGYELSNLVALADELRTRLYKVGIRVSRWDGPGAIAAALYKQYEIKSYIGAPVNPASDATRHAYAGGRFEIIRKGHSVDRAYQYDIRSAYPSAIRFLPCLAHGQWSLSGWDNTTRPVRFGMYRIEVIEPLTDHPSQPQPLWMRNRNGTVYFSEYAHGWYWLPEAQLAFDIAQTKGQIIIHEAWIWESKCNDHEPFHFVEPLYNKRAALKRAGDGAHVGLKLGLNSLYGKLAQQVGWRAGPPLQLPPYHCLEWAGYITSHCRSQIYRGCMASLDDVIAFETDAIFSRVPLGVTCGDRLGEWEGDTYESLTYLKSGMYYGTKNGKEIEKSRGINKGTITRDEVIHALHGETTTGKSLILQAEQTRFIGLGVALQGQFDKWRHWITAPRGISVGLSGKRIDLIDGEYPYAEKHDGWKETQEGFHDTTFSYPYSVAWINPEQFTVDGDDVTMATRIADAHDC